MITFSAAAAHKYDTNPVTKKIISHNDLLISCFSDEKGGSLNKMR